MVQVTTVVFGLVCAVVLRRWRVVYIPILPAREGRAELTVFSIKAKASGTTKSVHVILTIAPGTAVVR
jgi:hypothetical protein